DFCSLARLYSQDEDTRKQCGYMGVVRLSDLPPEVECRIVGCAPGEVVGPIRSIGSFHLYLVEDVFPAMLDDQTRDGLKEELVEEWLAAEVRLARVHWNV